MFPAAASATDGPPAGLTTGECLTVTDNAPDAIVAVRTDCSAADVAYRVLSVHDGAAECPLEEYLTETTAGGVLVRILCSQPHSI